MEQYYVIVNVQVGEYYYDFKDEGHGFDSEKEAQEFATEVWRELGHLATINIRKETTDRFGRFRSENITVVGTP